jgi:hypothetical protein
VSFFSEISVRKGLVKRTQKSKDLKGVESRFISEQKGIWQSPGVRVRKCAAFLKPRQRQE